MQLAQQSPAASPGARFITWYLPSPLQEYVQEAIPAVRLKSTAQAG